MNPTIERMRWFALALLALAEVLGQVLSNKWASLSLAILSFILIVISWGISRMLFFAPIRVTKAKVMIDTIPIRKTQREEYVELKVSMDFLLLYGAGGVGNEVELLWTEDVKRELNEFTSTSRRFCTVQFDESEGHTATELHLGIPKTLTGMRPLHIKKQVTEDVIHMIDELSERIENGNFQIRWKTSLGEAKVYKPRKQKR